MNHKIIDKERGKGKVRKIDLKVSQIDLKRLFAQFNSFFKLKFGQLLALNPYF
ncbi:hypothetical protein GM3709_2558 [Geminocystis sp. NIES-3709]|nr:hypothetical protein GM3709_2558 [Geminocystis sp. NIES-3709]